MRAEFPKATMRAAFERAEGRCELCGCKQRLEYHHRIEAYLGGEATLENTIVLCKSCHSLTTEERRPEIDKTRRISDKRMNIRRKSTFPGSRQSLWRKRMDGTVERR
jgi:5-methylcytosine-specific restriction endonuclease McrA